MVDRARDLRQIAKNIEQMGKTLASLEIRDQVDLGCALSMVIKKSESALESLKAPLRKEALKISGGQSGNQLFKGSEGSRCRVQIFNPSIRLRKDANISYLKSLLGAQFEDLFEEVSLVNPRKDFQNSAEKIEDQTTLQSVMGSVDILADKPKVFFEGGRD